METRTNHIQYNFWVDIWSLQQSSWMPFASSRITQDRLATINMLSATNLDGPAFNTRSRTVQHSSLEDTTPQADAVELNVTDTSSNTPKSLTVDRLQALLQMHKTDPFCKCISKWLSNREAPNHEADLFLHVKGLLYQHITDSHQKFLALVIPKA